MDRYNLHLGGNRIGTRIPRMYRENITSTEILAILDELIGDWAKTVYLMKDLVILLFAPMLLSPY